MPASRALKQRMHGKKTKTRRQVGYLLSSGSPLSKKQKAKLKRELHTRKVRVRG